jgi:hypothetical protein
MHPNSLKNLKPYPKGVSGNTGRTGYRQIPDALREVRSLSQLEVTKLISKYARLTCKELNKYSSDANLSVLDRAIVSVFRESILSGDFTRLAFLLDRCIGKIPVHIETDEEEEERDELKKLSMNELLTLVKTNLSEEK